MITIQFTDIKQFVVLNKKQNDFKKYENLRKKEEIKENHRNMFLIKYKSFFLKFFFLGTLPYTAFKSFVITYIKGATKNGKFAAAMRK